MKFIKDIFKKNFNRKVDYKLKEIESHRASYKEVSHMLKTHGCLYYVSADLWYITSRDVFTKLRNMGWHPYFYEIHDNGLYECKIVRL